MARIRRMAFVAIVMCVLWAVPGDARAQSLNDFVITSFDATYDLTNEDPQGLLKIEETIAVDYAGRNRGILRAIPESYRGEDVNPRVVSVMKDGASEPFITYLENQNLVVRIGDESIYLTDTHVYEIRYEVENVITFEDTHDELFWDVNGTDGFVPVDAARVVVASKARLSAANPKCFTGTFRSRLSECTMKRNTESFESQTTRTLAAGETLTVVAAYDKGYFTPPGFVGRNRPALFSVPFAAIALIIANSARKRWVVHGKEYATRGLVAPFFSRPKNLSVMQAGYVHENKLTTRHMSASIIDLAIRGYIQITERKKGRSVKHDVTLVKKVDSHVTSDEKVLLAALAGTTVGKTVELESIKNTLHTTYESLKKNVDTETSKKGFYDLSPKEAQKTLIPHIVAAIVLLAAGAISAAFTGGISLFVGVFGVVAVFVYRAFMSKRSKDGNTLVEHMEGLKLYLDRAEKDRIEQQDAVAAPLSNDHDQPVRDVKFFEKLLPFAVAMGVEKSWSDAFKDVYVEAPEWYSGNWTTFTTANLVRGVSSTTAAASASFSPPTSSGSSGFSGGGGFAGGGGGGGGVGGW